MENFRGKRDFLKGGPFALSDQFQAPPIGSLGTVNGTANPIWKFPFGF